MDDYIVQYNIGVIIGKLIMIVVMLAFFGAWEIEDRRKRGKP